MSTFPSQDHPDDAQTKEQTSVQADLYGMKVRVNPSPEQGIDRQRTIGVVLGSLWQNLLKLLDGTCTLAGNLPYALDSLVRGIGNLPAAINKRVTQGHVQAEQREMLAQEAAPDVVTNEGITVEIAQLQVVVAHLEAKGLKVGIQQDQNGKLIVTSVRPELEDAAHHIAIEAIQSHQAPLENKVGMGMVDSLIRAVERFERDLVGARVPTDEREFRETLGRITKSKIGALHNAASERLEVSTLPNSEWHEKLMLIYYSMLQDRRGMGLVLDLWRAIQATQTEQVDYETRARWQTLLLCRLRLIPLPSDVHGSSDSCGSSPYYPNPGGGD